jgi:hypothetical protein
MIYQLQAIDTLVKELARFFKKCEVPLLPCDNFVQFLPQIFLISGLDLQLDESLLVHALEFITPATLFNVVVDDNLVRLAVSKTHLFNNTNQIARLRHGIAGFGNSCQQPDLFEVR